MRRTSRVEGRGRRALAWAAASFVLFQVGAAAVVGANRHPARSDEGRLTGPPMLTDSLHTWLVRLALDGDRPDVVFIGDSSCSMGIIPAEVEAVAGRPAMNLGTYGPHTIDGHADMLQLAVDRHGPPRAVVYHTTSLTYWGVQQPDVYYREFRRWLDQYYRPAPFAWDDPLAAVPSSRLRRLVQDGLPRLTTNRARRKALLAAPRGAYPSDDELGAILFRERGYMEEPAEKSVKDEDWPGYAASNREWSRTGGIHETVRPSLVRLFRMAQAGGFDLWLVAAPIPEEHRGPDVEAAYADARAALQALAADNPRVHVEHHRPRYYPHRLLRTFAHPSREGAAVNSRELAALIDPRAGRVLPEPPR